MTLRLGINIDHVATLRNARGGSWPDPALAAKAARDGGADGITIHLREDRRHIRDADLAAIRAATTLPINLEMAATAEMQAIALEFLPHAACIVPEKRFEVTTEGGLDVAGKEGALRPLVRALSAAGIRVSMFIDPDPRQVAASAAIGAQAVELHTGRYCDAAGSERAAELDRLLRAAKAVAATGMECHAGHGLSYDTVGAVAAIAEIIELNIGHFLIGAALFDGLVPVVAKMKALMAAARA
ncbi:MAG: pyridoxine 5'-phosphate synthase [Acetobacteraceae bacterium]|nr:pyridoxine 5'-phosphate synthase [Acetobacteraceae bacterium]